MTDRGFRVAASGIAAQCTAVDVSIADMGPVLRDDSRRLGAPLDPKGRERLADPLVDSMRQKFGARPRFLSS